MNKIYVSLAAMVFVVATAFGCGGQGGTATSTQDGDDQVEAFNEQTDALHDPNLQLIYTPSPAGHQPFVDAITHANRTVHMVMFQLADPDVMTALKDAHVRLGTVDGTPAVRVILDRKSLEENSDLETNFTTLHDAGVDVMRSSAGFTYTHEKSMVVDDTTVFITAMNMNTRGAYDAERDFGVITRDDRVITEWNSVFAEDVRNSASTTDHGTPALSVRPLLWSPVRSSAESKLISLIGSARSSIITTVENLSDPGIVGALSNAAKGGVNVRIITPQCVKGNNPKLDYPALRSLAADGVATKVMPYPATPTHPYMHSKMILVDQRVAYVGSVNFTETSLLRNREAGIIFVNDTATQTIRQLFETDWTNAIDVPATDPTFCPATQ
jgi:cardiolipin synthase